MWSMEHGAAMYLTSHILLLMVAEGSALVGAGGWLMVELPLRDNYG